MIRFTRQNASVPCEGSSVFCREIACILTHNAFRLLPMLLSIPCPPQPLQHCIHFSCIFLDCQTSRLHGFVLPPAATLIASSHWCECARDFGVWNLKNEMWTCRFAIFGFRVTEVMGVMHAWHHAAWLLKQQRVSPPPPRKDAIDYDQEGSVEVLAIASLEHKEPIRRTSRSRKIVSVNITHSKQY